MLTTKVALAVMRKMPCQNCHFKTNGYTKKFDVAGGEKNCPARDQKNINALYSLATALRRKYLWKSD